MRPSRGPTVASRGDGASADSENARSPRVRARERRWARRAPRVILGATHPGIVETQVRRDAPGLYCVHIVGAVAADVPREIYDEIRRTMDGVPFVLLLVHVDRVGRVDPRARQGAIEEARSVPLRGVAFVGASFPFRALATLLHTAGDLLGRKDDNPLRFFAGEPEARAWLRARADALRGGSAGG